MKTSQFILTMVAAFMLAGFISSCGLPPDLTLLTARAGATATVQAIQEPDLSSTTQPTVSLLVTPTTATPLAPEKPDPTKDTPKATPTLTQPATPTPIPASWKTFSDAALKIQFRYPPEWQTGSPLKLKGADGFVEVSLQDYPASLFDVMRTVCVLEANTGRPAAYGAGPLISDWQGWDTERQAWVGTGCSVMPSPGISPDVPAQTVLYARYPPPQMPNKLLVVRADAAHFAGILSTLRFQEYSPGVPSNGYYNSPTCDGSQVGKPQMVLRTDTLVITEIAIVHKNCDPWLHFDGFRTLASISGAEEMRREALKNGSASSGGSANQVVGTADPFSYEYAKAPLFPVGAPSQVRILRDGQLVDTLSVAHAGPAGYPVVGFWSWKGHWLLEMDNVVVEDGELLNNTMKYSQIFGWHLMNDEPFFFFQEGSSYGIHYAGQELPLHYDDIIHGQLCCGPATYSIINTPTGAWFYALKGETWTMVQVQLK